MCICAVGFVWLDLARTSYKGRTWRGRRGRMTDGRRSKCPIDNDSILLMSLVGGKVCRPDRDGAGWRMEDGGQQFQGRSRRNFKSSSFTFLGFLYGLKTQKMKIKISQMTSRRKFQSSRSFSLLIPIDGQTPPHSRTDAAPPMTSARTTSPATRLN